MKRNLIAAAAIAVLILGFGGSALAGSGAGAINQTFPIGARYNALGEAGVALSQDVTAQWWNPAGLAFLPQRNKPQEFQIMHSALAAGLADDINLIWLGGATPLGDIGAVAASLNYLGMGEQDATDVNGTVTGQFESYMFAVQASYGVRILPTVGVGLGIKYFRDRLAPDIVTADSQVGSGSGDSFGVDLGTMIKVPMLRSNFAVAVANLGPDITHVDSEQSDPMPRKITAGFATSLVSNEMGSALIVFDYQVPLYKWGGNDYKFGLEFDQKEFGGGLEAGVYQSVFGRLGYKSAEYGDIKGLTWGFGADLEKFTDTAVIFDFGVVPQASGLPSVKRLSVGIRF